jgi:hypothetical protein
VGRNFSARGGMDSARLIPQQISEQIIMNTVFKIILSLFTNTKLFE